MSIKVDQEADTIGIFYGACLPIQPHLCIVLMCPSRIERDGPEARPASALCPLSVIKLTCGQFWPEGGVHTLDILPSIHSIYLPPEKSWVKDSDLSGGCFFYPLSRAGKITSVFYEE